MTSQESPWRAGDHVRHIATGETWVVAYVDGDYLSWCGWPNGEAPVSDFELVARCTDEEHVECLRELAESGGKRAHRAAIALAERVSGKGEA